MLYWYKHGLGQKPVLVSTKYKFDEKVLFYNEFKDNPRVQLSPEKHLRFKAFRQRLVLLRQHATLRVEFLRAHEHRCENWERFGYPDGGAWVPVEEVRDSEVQRPRWKLRRTSESSLVQTVRRVVSGSSLQRRRRRQWPVREENRRSENLRLQSARTKCELRADGNLLLRRGHLWVPAFQEGHHVKRSATFSLFWMKMFVLTKR